MRKKTKALSGASQDAYFRRVLKAHPNLSADDRDELVRKLRQEVAQLRVRVEPHREGDAPQRDQPAKPPRRQAPAPAAVEVEPAASVAEPAVVVATAAFDPFSPNVILMVRQAGRAAALAALEAIQSLDQLHLLAREQRLRVAGDPSSLADMRTAIVTAAERRIANRIAAAS